MSLPTSILCPVDYDACSEAALATAAELGQRLGARVQVLHVLHVTLPIGVRDSWDFDVEEALERSSRASAERLETWVKERTPAGVVLETRAVVGDPVDEILEAVESSGIDLVVVGTHGRKGIQRAFLGSVAERVVRRCPCPVLTTRARSGDGADR